MLQTEVETGYALALVSLGAIPEEGRSLREVPIRENIRTALFVAGVSLSDDTDQHPKRASTSAYMCRFFSCRRATSFYSLSSERIGSIVAFLEEHLENAKKCAIINLSLASVYEDELSIKIKSALSSVGDKGIMDVDLQIYAKVLMELKKDKYSAVSADICTFLDAKIKECAAAGSMKNDLRSRGCSVQ